MSSARLAIATMFRLFRPFSEEVNGKVEWLDGESSLCGGPSLSFASVVERTKPPPLPPHRKPEVLSSAALPLNSLTRLLDLDVASCAVIELNEDDRSVGIAGARLRETEVLSVAIADAGVSPRFEGPLSIGGEYSNLVNLAG